MKIKKFDIDGYHMTFDTDICVLTGHDSELCLDFIGVLLSDNHCSDSIERDEMTLYYLYSDIEDCDDIYHVTYFYCKTEPHIYSVGDVIGTEYKQSPRGYANYTDMRRYCSQDMRNVFCGVKSLGGLIMAGESDRLQAKFEKFVTDCEALTNEGDERPILIYGLFERLCESVDIMPMIDSLKALGRQVIIAAPSCSAERFAMDGVRVYELDTMAPEEI